jgi:hypothetical protein
MLLKLIKKALRNPYVKSRLHYEKWFGEQIIQNQERSAPDFFIIGTPKGGTTSLAQYLYKHPRIIPPAKKECEYFSWRKHQGLNNYLQNFPLKKEAKNCLTFEATPSYLYFEDAPKNIANFFPDIKLIALLRDPVNRAYSDWNFHHDSAFVRNREDLRDKRSFNKAIQIEFKDPTLITPPKGFGYLLKGEYSKHLKSWYNHFPKEQLLLLESADLRECPQKVLNEITNFLGLPPFDGNLEKGDEKVNQLLEIPDENESNSLKEYNVNKYKEPMSEQIKSELEKYFVPYNEELKKITGRTFSWMK